MEPVLKHYDAASATEVLDSVIVPLYVASHQHLSDQFHSTERFAERTRSYLRAPGFGMVVAFVDGQPVAQAFGYALPPNARWWQGLTTPVEDGFTNETGNRTFALNELMVMPEWEGKGMAKAAHHELMRSRTEDRATLLVDPDNERAKSMYEHLGYVKIGTLRPFPDAPNFDAMILPLPITV
jgi:ribosomal protein S18 acetylase RimI-like enzyme